MQRSLAEQYFMYAGVLAASYSSLVMRSIRFDAIHGQSPKTGALYAPFAGA